MTMKFFAADDGSHGLILLNGVEVVRVTENGIVYGVNQKGNLIVNADCSISQERGTATASLTAGIYAYICDVFIAAVNGAGTTAQQISNATGAPSGCADAIQINGAANVTNPQGVIRLESTFTKHLAGQAIVFAIDVYNSSGNTLAFGATISRANAVDNFSAVTADTTLTCSTTSIPTGSWTRVICKGTLSANATTGLSIAFSCSGNLSTGVVQFTGFDFFEGTSARIFSKRKTELALVRRVYATDSFSIVANAAGAGSLAGYGPSFDVTMRAAPQITVGTPVVNSNVSLITKDNITNTGFRIYATAAAAGTMAYTAPYTRDIRL